MVILSLLLEEGLCLVGDAREPFAGPAVISPKASSSSSKTPPLPPSEISPSISPPVPPPLIRPLPPVFLVELGENLAANLLAENEDEDEEDEEEPGSGMRVRMVPPFWVIRRITSSLENDDKLVIETHI